MPPLISERLRKARKQKKLTIAQLAKEVGCSKSYISQLENGTTKPSVTMLGKLVDALEARITDFFDEERTGNDVPDSPSVEQERSTISSECLVRSKDRRTIDYPDGKTRSHFLTRAVYHKKMQPIFTVIEPGGESQSDEDLVHPEGSEEFVIVLKGEIEFELRGEKFHILKGDSLYFDGNTPHKWRNVSDQTAEVLFVWTPAVW